MTIEDRIKEIEDYLNDYYGHNVCDGTHIGVWATKEGKLVVSYNKNRYHVRERRRGRGIQLARIINLISGSGTITDKTLVIGKDKDDNHQKG